MCMCIYILCTFYTYIHLIHSHILHKHTNMHIYLLFTHICIYLIYKYISEHIYLIQTHTHRERERGGRKRESVISTLWYFSKNIFLVKIIVFMNNFGSSMDKCLKQTKQQLNFLKFIQKKTNKKIGKFKIIGISIIFDDKQHSLSFLHNNFFQSVKEIYNKLLAQITKQFSPFFKLIFFLFNLFFDSHH